MHTITVTREAMRGRAAALVPVLSERAAQAEQLRRLPDETLADLVGAGLFRIANPDRFGGVGLDVDSVFDVAVELGRGCGSTAWVYGVLSSHNWMVGLWPEQGQEEYFAAGPDTLASSAFDPGRASVEVVAGGYQLSGHWSFSSGCDVASWAMVGGLGPTGLIYFLVPMAEVTIVDNWFVSGLRGTGSKDLVINDVFVPTHRAAELRLLGEGQSDGWALHRRLSYRLPVRSMLSLTLAAPALGMARGVVEAFRSQLHDRRGPSGASLTEAVANQLHVAEAAAEVDAATALLWYDTREMLDLAARGAMPTLLDRARYRRDQAFITRLSLRAVNRLMESSGGHAIHESNPLQRLQRDIQAAAQHFSLKWDETAEQYGRVALGLAPAPTARL